MTLTLKKKTIRITDATAQYSSNGEPWFRAEILGRRNRPEAVGIGPSLDHAVGQLLFHNQSMLGIHIDDSLIQSKKRGTHS